MVLIGHATVVELSAARPLRNASPQGDWVQAVWLSPFPYQMFGTIVGFIVVFRCAASHPLCRAPVPEATRKTLTCATAGRNGHMNGTLLGGMAARP